MDDTTEVEELAELIREYLPGADGAADSRSIAREIQQWLARRDAARDTELAKLRAALDELHATICSHRKCPGGSLCCCIGDLARVKADADALSEVRNWRDKYHYISMPGAGEELDAILKVGATK